MGFPGKITAVGSHLLLHKKKIKVCKLLTTYAEACHGSGQLHFLNPVGPSLQHIISLLSPWSPQDSHQSLVLLSNSIMYPEEHKPSSQPPVRALQLCGGCACLYRQLSLSKGQNPIYRPDLPFRSWTDEGKVLSVLSEIIWGNLLCSKNANKRQDE